METINFKITLEHIFTIIHQSASKIRGRYPDYILIHISHKYNIMNEAYKRNVLWFGDSLRMCNAEVLFTTNIDERMIKCLYDESTISETFNL